MERAGTQAWATKQTNGIMDTDIGNNGEGPGGDVEGQLMSSRLKVMESKLLMTYKKRSWTYYRSGTQKEVHARHTEVTKVYKYTQ